ncbi:cytochrome P450 [Rouxiella sp. Mn2063]|uniref:cytochrome P450 n=1 Tax=Rouxiella sp. Mn2063 TaxID=3395262 RepID=UPI003BDB86FF
MQSCPHAVKQQLNRTDLFVRPIDEPIPHALQNTRAGEVFSHLVRMNDGAFHQALKTAIVAALAAFTPDEISQIAEHCARHICADFPAEMTAENVTYFNYALPVCAVAQLLGVAAESHRELLNEVLPFIRCIAPGSNAEQLALGVAASERLFQRIALLLKVPGPLLKHLQQACHQQEITDPNVVIANAMGLLFQTCEGTAGLISQALLLGDNYNHGLQNVIERVLSQTPPIMTTRRFNHKSPEPLVLSLAQGNAFGSGAHACPGERWASLLALSAIRFLTSRGAIDKAIQHYRWRESLNARVAEFFTFVVEEPKGA